MSKPLFTIVTICYNAENCIKETIDSLLNQEFTNYEYIIIDGDSKDGTQNIIKMYIKKFSNRYIKTVYVSEKDNGIYDAMNKAIHLAEGEWIYFLNSGDRLYRALTLNNIAKFLQRESCDIVYGDVCLDGNEEEVQYADEIEKIRNIMPFSHQAVFVKSLLYKCNLFSLDYKIAADYDFFLKQFFADKKFKKVDDIIAYYDTNGISSNNLYCVEKEFLNIKIKYGIVNKSLKTSLKYFWNVFKIFVKLHLPKKAVKKIMKIKRNI